MSKAIVSSGNRRLIGELVEDKSEALPGDNVIVQKALELRCDMFVLPTPQGPVGVQKTTVTPIDAEEEPVDILVKIDNIRWFDEMTDRGRKYENMVAEFEQMMVQNRAGRAGIAVAQQVPKQDPKGGGIIL
jgi:hypothetical protein